MTGEIRRRRRRQRRNEISHRDALGVWVATIATMLGATTAGCEPTGHRASDLAWTAAGAGLVAWAGASAPWWAVMACAFTAAVAATTTPLLAVAGLASLIAIVVAARRSSAPWARSAAIGAALAVLLRSDLAAPSHLTALLTVSAAGLVVVTGLRRRNRRRRRLVVLGAATTGALCLLAFVGLLIAGWQGAGDSVDGREALEAGLQSAGSGDTAEAAARLADAADELDAAAGHLDGWTAWPAQFVPVLAQHRTALGAVTEDAADAARAASEAVGLIDPTQLELVGGALDVDAVGLIAEPVARLDAAITRLAASTGRGRTTWLIPPVSRRFDDVLIATDEVGDHVRTVGAVAAEVPGLFGEGAPRRYMIAFTNPAEARSQSGVMGNWAELTATDGRLEQTAFGRTSELAVALGAAEPFALDIDPDFLTTYARAGAAQPGSGTVSPVFWSNVTMSPHMPDVGSVMAQMYAAATGRPLDGVIIVDPAGVASLLRLTGPIEAAGVELTAGGAEAFLTVEQYEQASGERERTLEALTAATMDALTSSVIVDPVAAADALGRAATEGHLVAWFADPGAQRLAERLGIDGSLPTLDRGDGLAITVDNAAGNKIDSFLHTNVTYTAVMDADGSVSARLVVEVRNEAPTSGFPDYVIGNLVGLPPGTSSILVNVRSPLWSTAVEVDGVAQPVGMTPERGWHVYTVPVVTEPGGTSRVEIELEGAVTGDYRLVVRGPSLPRPTRWRLEATDPDGRVLAGFLGTLETRSVLDGSGLRTWSAATD